MRKLFFVLTAALLALLVVNFRVQELGAQQPTTAVKAPALKFGDPLPANLFIELAKAINPAIVNISTFANNRGLSRDPLLDQLERFYGLRLDRRPRDSTPLSRTRS